MVSNVLEGDGYFGWLSGDLGEVDDEYWRYFVIL